MPIFAGLSIAQRREVAEFARPVRVEADQPVFLMGERTRPGSSSCTRVGWSEGTARSEAGRETIVRVLGPGEVAGELSFVTGARPEHDAVALEPAARLCTFAHADLGRLLQRFPDIGLEMLKVLALRLNSAERMLTALAAADVGARVAAYLLDCPTTWDAGGRATVHLPMAKKGHRSTPGDQSGDPEPPVGHVRAGWASAAAGRRHRHPRNPTPGRASAGDVTSR